MDPKVDHSIRIQAAKELHSLSKTSVLLLRDLPFVANLSKYYDLSKLNNALTSKSSSTYSNNKQNIISDTLRNEQVKGFESSVNRLDFTEVKDGKTEMDDGGLNVHNKDPDKYKNLDDEIMKDMQRQVHIADSLKGNSIEEMTEENWDKIVTPEHKESVRKLREILDD